MGIIDFDKSLLRLKIEEGGIVLVDCWANWCSACVDFAPIFERVSNRFPSHTFGKLNTQTEIELSEILEITHVPSLLLYRGGFLLFRQHGYFNEEELADIVKQAESLDMDKVRAQINQELKSKTNEDTSSNQDNQ